MKPLVLRLIGLGSWLGAAVSYVWQWEPARAFVYDRVFRMLESPTISEFIADYGVPIALVIVGTFLFWFSGRRPSPSADRKQPSNVAVPDRRLEILFDEHDDKFVRDKSGYYGGIQTRSWFVGLHNASITKNIDDVTLRAHDSQFVQCTIAVERIRGDGRLEPDRIVAEFSTISPDATEFVKLFSMSGTDIWGEQDILAKKQTFTLEVRGRDTPKATLTLEYDPSTRPPIIRRTASMTPGEPWPDFKKWDKANTFELYEAACLWFDRDPILRMPENALNKYQAWRRNIFDGKIPIDTDSVRHAVEIGANEEASVTPHSRIRREILVGLAEHERIWPLFLFPHKRGERR